MAPFCPTSRAASTVGDTLAEAENNIREAIEGHIAAMKEHGETIPRPTTLAEYVENINCSLGSNRKRLWQRILEK